MNTEHHLEEFPRLVPPDVVYKGKSALKKSAVVPLYAKIASAAAVAALLAVLFWHHPARPEVELMATLKPKDAGCIETPLALCLSGQRARFVNKAKTSVRRSPAKDSPSLPVTSTASREELPLLAGLSPVGASLLPSADPSYVLFPADNDPVLDEMEYIAWNEEDDLSLARRGFQRMTDGQFDSFGEMLRYGWRSVKTELAQVDETISENISALKQKNF